MLGFIELQVVLNYQTLNIFTISDVEDILFEEIKAYFSSPKQEGLEYIAKLFSGDADQENQILKLSKLQILTDTQIEVFKDTYTFENNEYNTLKGYNLFTLIDVAFRYIESSDLLAEIDLYLEPERFINHAYDDLLLYLYYANDNIKLKELYLFLLEWKTSLEFRVHENLPHDVQEKEIFDINAFKIIEDYIDFNYYILVSENMLPADFKYKKRTGIFAFFFAPNFLNLQEIKLSELENYESPELDETIEYMKSRNLEMAYIL